MFWSGTAKIAHAYSNRGLDFITLEDTLAGGVADGLNWCGSATGDGFNYASCPRSCESNVYADLAYWGLASQTVGRLHRLHFSHNENIYNDPSLVR